MKVGLKNGRVICLLALITSILYSAPVMAEEALVCTEVQFSVVSLNLDQSKTVLACLDTFDSAKESMNTFKTDYPDLVITHNSSKSPEKIVAASRAIATSYPQRRNSGTANAVTMNIFQTINFTGNSTYMNAYRDMAYYDTFNFNSTTGAGVALVQISGFTGYTPLEQIDIIPMIYIENNWLISLGGQPFYPADSLQVYQIRPRMNEYRISTSSVYNVREIYHETFSFASGGSLGVYVYGQAPDWLVNGTYYSWDSIRFFYDKAMTQPVLNGETPGEYYNYYQYLPFRSGSNMTAKHLDDYLIALGFTKKATYFGEPSASAMYGEGKAFIDGQMTYGANALLVYAMGLHESGRGTSRLSIEKNNIFGWGAVDSNPDDAFKFESVALSVAEHMGRNLRGYMSVENFRFYGTILGNKNNGFNTKYASDPYWGNKIAGWAYRIDRYYGFPDYNHYTIGIMPDSENLAVKKSADNNSSTMFVIPSITYQRSLLINSTIDTANGQWISIMSTQPVTLSDNVVLYKDTSSELTKYEWFKSIGYLPANNIKIIYPGNGVSKIPMVYDEAEFAKEPVVNAENFVLNEGILTFNGFAFKPGLSVPLTSVASYQLSFVNEDETSISRPLTAGTENPLLNQTYGGVKFDYKGAVYGASIDIKDFPAGRYRFDLYASFNILKDPVYFSKSISFEPTLPEISNHLGRSYELTKDENNVLYLVIEDVEVIVLKGDVNGDGKVTITDLVMLHLTISGVDKFEEFNTRNADMNSDGKISITDIVMLHLLISGIEY
jgi:beta-N-acetylglucosaminidase